MSKPYTATLSRLKMRSKELTSCMPSTSNGIHNEKTTIAPVKSNGHSKILSSSHGTLNGMMKSMSFRRPPLLQIVPKKHPSASNLATGQMNAFGTVEIYFKNNATQVDVGDVVHGWVELNLNEPIRAMELLIDFYGEVTYDLGDAFAKQEGALEEDSLTSVQKRQFERVSHALWKSSEQKLKDSQPSAFQQIKRETVRDDLPGIVLDPGVHVFDFYVGTSRFLPATFISKGTVRQIQYFCEATLVEFLEKENQLGQLLGDTLYHVRRRRITLIGPGGHISRAVNANGEPVDSVEGTSGVSRTIGPTVASDNVPAHVSQSISSKAMLRVRNVLDISGNIVATVTLKKQLYRPGEHICFNAELLNCFRQLKVDALLIQRAKCLVDGKIQAVRQDILRVRLGELQSSDTYQFWHGRCLWVPSPSIVPVDLRVVYPGRLINVQNAFVLRIKPWCRKALEIEIPIVVEAPNLKLQSSTGSFRKVATESKASDTLRRKTIGNLHEKAVDDRFKTL